MQGRSLLPALRSIFARSAKRLLQLSFYKGLTKASGGQEKALLWSYGQLKLSAFLIYQGYAQGKYPIPSMNYENQVDWFDPQVRGIIPIDTYTVRADLVRRMKKERNLPEESKTYVKINSKFEETILSCANARGSKRKTWLTSEYIDSLLDLHQKGIAHSVEAYQNGALVGGVVGISINGFFATLSLFHTVDNASKIAFCYLLQKLKDDGFKLHHCGDVGTWFSQFGMLPINQDDYREELMRAVTSPVVFTSNVPTFAV